MLGMAFHCCVLGFLDQYNIIALSETKWDVPTDDLLPGFKHFVMPKKGQSHRYRGIHGLCVFVRKHLVDYIHVIDDTLSDSVLWLIVDKKSFWYDFFGGCCLYCS